MKKQITQEEIKILQLDILTRVHDFCVNHNIQYSLSSGTLIGAVRHKGYIPWDDDIDIYMLRTEYERFEREFKDDRCRILSVNTNRKCIYPFAKVYDDRTVLIEDVKYNTKDLGVNIDIFQVDSLPDDLIERQRLLRKNRMLGRIIQLKQMKYRKGRGVKKNVLFVLSRIPLFFVPFHFLVSRKAKIGGKFNPKAKEICNIMDGNGRATIPIGIMQNLIDIEFEGRWYKCMKDYDIYLKKAYGDYMQLPPVEKRITHHAYKAYWK